MGLFDLDGRRALVTGSSQGIGLALARGLADAGAAIVLNGRSASKLEAVDLAGADRLAFDVTDHAAVRAAIDGYETERGPIDIVVNNAGVQHRTPLEDFPPEDFERLMRSNVSGLFNVAQACARHMIARGSGKVVNIASVNALLARATIAPYTATKGAVANLTKGMATDWARHGLKPVPVAPSGAAIAGSGATAAARGSPGSATRCKLRRRLRSAWLRHTRAMPGDAQIGAPTGALLSAGAVSGSCDARACPHCPPRRAGWPRGGNGRGSACGGAGGHGTSSGSRRPRPCG